MFATIGRLYRDRVRSLSVLCTNPTNTFPDSGQWPKSVNELLVNDEWPVVRHSAIILFPLWSRLTGNLLIAVE